MLYVKSSICRAGRHNKEEGGHKVCGGKKEKDLSVVPPALISLRAKSFSPCLELKSQVLLSAYVSQGQKRAGCFTVNNLMGTQRNLRQRQITF